MSRVRNLRKRGRDAGAVDAVNPAFDADVAAADRAMRRAERLAKKAELSDADRAAWAAVADATEPLYKITPEPPSRKSRSAIVTADRDPIGTPRSQASVPTLKPETLDILLRRGVGGDATARPPRSSASAGQSVSPLPSLPALPRTESRRIAKGALSIDARLDLHGMTRDAAERALAHFLRSAQGQGFRTVLVITGKGVDPAALRDRPFDADLDVAPRGVLKRVVPDWLRRRAWSDVVAGFGNAHARHGGDGALYVMIKRRRV